MYDAMQHVGDVSRPIGDNLSMKITKLFFLPPTGQPVASLIAVMLREWLGEN